MRRLIDFDGTRSTDNCDAKKIAGISEILFPRVGQNEKRAKIIRAHNPSDRVIPATIKLCSATV